ncbi:unnamed protein product [Oikopleura dioica]|uniref:UNC93-like protein MFSD11 n=1 Tax=Oikopleura dioica TaxID=34765 RepID=E4X3H3_OIKDI|nr:unnamed protein product [Oikopleura dioica]
MEENDFIVECEEERGARSGLSDKWKLVNVILMGFAFMLLYTAFLTTSMIGKYVTDSLKIEIREDFENNDDFSKFNHSHWQQFKTGVVQLLGYKTTMFIASLTYLLYILVYLNPTPLFLYTASVLNGAGGAFLWTAQGAFLHHLSGTEQLMSRNTGIFTAFFLGSMINGNLYIMIAWQGEKYVSSEMRRKIITIFAILASFGCFLLLFLHGRCCALESAKKNKNPPKQAFSEFFQSIKRTFKLIFTEKMALLAPYLIYYGFYFSFLSGVYPTIVGNSKNLEDSSAQVGFTGMLTGIGGLISCAVFIFGGKFCDKINRLTIAFSFLAIHLVAFLLASVNFPNDANFTSTDALPDWNLFGSTNLYIALIISFLIGFGDGGLKVVLYSSISEAFPADTTSVFALKQFIETLSIATCFFISSSINLIALLSILIALNILSIISFFLFRKRLNTE